MALGEGQGKSGYQAGAISTISVGTSSTEVLSAANAAIIDGVSFFNDSPVKMYLAVGVPAESGKGIPLAAGAGVFFTGADCARAAVNAIAASPTSNMSVHMLS